MQQTTNEYDETPINEDLLMKIGNYAAECQPLVPGIETEIGLVDNRAHDHDPVGFFGCKAPYYLLIYSAKHRKAVVNTGCLAQQIGLYLLSQGISVKLPGMLCLKGEPSNRGDKELLFTIAFGKARGGAPLRTEEKKRVPEEKFCALIDPPEDWMRPLIEAGSVNPSGRKHQPWLLVSRGGALHVFCKGSMQRDKDQTDMGIMLANLMVVQDELWLDIDMIRLGDMAERSFRSSEYVISLVPKQAVK